MSLAISFSHRQRFIEVDRYIRHCSLHKNLGVATELIPNIEAQGNTGNARISSTTTPVARQSGQCQSREAERHFDGDEQGPDALEGLLGRFERQGSDRRYEAARAWTGKEGIAGPEQQPNRWPDGCGDLSVPALVDPRH